MPSALAVFRNSDPFPLAWFSKGKKRKNITGGRGVTNSRTAWACFGGGQQSALTFATAVTPTVHAALLGIAIFPSVLGLVSSSDRGHRQRPQPLWGVSWCAALLENPMSEIPSPDITVGAVRHRRTANYCCRIPIKARLCTYLGCPRSTLRV